MSKTSAQGQATTVETVVLKPQASTERWQAVGTIKAAQDIIVSSQVTGTIQNMSVASGQAVQEGDILVNINHADILANLQKDQAILTQKQLFYQRQQRLLNTKAISEEAVSEALSEYQQAQASVTADQAELDKYVIKAPFSGIIGIWQIDTGQLVKQGDPLVTLTQLSPAFIDFMLPANVLSKISVGDNIQFTSSSYVNRAWSGKVIAIDPQLDSSTRSLQLRAQIDNQDGKLVPGLYGQVVVVKPLPPQLYIPQEAVVYDPQGASVYVVKNNSAQPQHVTLGTHQGDEVIVLSGLKANDEVVTAGMMKLFPNMPVTVNKRVQQSS